MLFIADRGNFRVRVVNLTVHTVSVAGVKIKAGNIATIAGNGDDLWNGGEGSLSALDAAIRPNGLAIDNDGNLFIAHARSDRTPVHEPRARARSTTRAAWQAS